LLQRSRQAGFSLLELLVVVFIIALGAELISLAIGTDNPQQLRTSATEFANLAALVEEEAVLSREPWGVQIYREISEGNDIVAYRFLRFAGEKGWQVEAPRDIPAGGHFAENITAVLELEGAEQLIEPLPEKKPPLPTIWLAPGGEVTPFVLQLRFKGANDGPVVRSDALGRIELELQKNDELLK
jgi:general secretion pathway protein H